MKLLTPLLVLSFLLFGFSDTTHASDTTVSSAISAPDKDSLLKAWENSLKSDVTTEKFVKLPENNIYDFETNLFPYKGKLKVINIIIDNNPYDYDSYVSDDTTYMGIVETDLVDAPEKFFSKLPASYDAWEKLNRLYYSKDTKQWMNRDEWHRFNTTKHAANKLCKPAVNNHRYDDLWISYAPLGGVMIVFFVVLFFARRQRRVYLDKYNVTMDRQLETLNSIKESVQLQREIKELLASQLSKR